MAGNSKPYRRAFSLSFLQKKKPSKATYPPVDEFGRTLEPQMVHETRLETSGWWHSLPPWGSQPGRRRVPEPALEYPPKFDYLTFPGPSGFVAFPSESSFREGAVSSDEGCPSPHLRPRRKPRSPEYTAVPDLSGPAASQHERYYRPRHRAVSFDGGAPHLQSSQSSPLRPALRHPNSTSKVHRQVAFRLKSDLAPQLVNPEEPFCFRSRSLKERLLNYRYDLIPATHVYPVYECAVRIKDFPWLIKIGPRGDGGAKGGVQSLTAFDILISIQIGLLGAEEETDYDSDGPLWKYKDSGHPKEVFDAYRKRVNKQNLVMWKESFRRIDWLKGRHYFEGLLDSTQSGEWILMLGKREEYSIPRPRSR